MREPTDRQIEVLEAYLATGSYRGAAAELGVGYGTVRGHLVSLRLKLGCDNTAQAVYLLARSGRLGVGRRT